MKSALLLLFEPRLGILGYHHCCDYHWRYYRYHRYYYHFGFLLLKWNLRLDFDFHRAPGSSNDPVCLVYLITDKLRQANTSTPNLMATILTGWFSATRFQTSIALDHVQHVFQIFWTILCVDQIFEIRYLMVIYIRLKVDIINNGEDALPL